MAITQSDIINKVCVAGVAGSAYYLLLFIWDIKE